MAERWLPLAEAAAALGLSVDATRRRVKGGALVAEKRETPQGGAWWVLVRDGDPPPGAPPGGSSASAERHQAPPGEGNGRHHADEAAHLAGLVRELQGEVIRRSEAAATWQARAEVLAIRLEQAERRILALEAPREDPTGRHQARVAPNLAAHAPEPTTEPPRPAPEPTPSPIPPGPDGRAWWRRVWAVLLSAPG
jgi:hypothetical protein